VRGVLLPAVGEDGVVVAAGILEGVSEDGHGGEFARSVDVPGERQYGIRSPCGIEDNRAEWISEDVVEKGKQRDPQFRGTATPG